MVEAKGVEISGEQIFIQDFKGLSYSKKILKGAFGDKSLKEAPPIL